MPDWDTFAAILGVRWGDQEPERDSHPTGDLRGDACDVSA